MAGRVDSCSVVGRDHGTPHLHVQVHVASIYQFGTMADVVSAFKSQAFSLEQLEEYTKWLCAEDILDKDVHKDMQRNLEAEWQSRFSGKEHDDMSQTPKYLQHEAKAIAIGKAITVSTPEQDSEVVDALAADGDRFRRAYLADAQRMFCRVQHHMHRSTKHGKVPLKGCLKKHSKSCKHGFPKPLLRSRKAGNDVVEGYISVGRNACRPNNPV